MTISIDKAIRDLQARVDGEFTLPFEGIDDCADMKLGIEALKLYKRAREQYPIIRPYWLPGETKD